MRETGAQRAYVSARAQGCLVAHAHACQGRPRRGPLQEARGAWRTVQASAGGLATVPVGQSLHAILGSLSAMLAATAVTLSAWLSAQACGGSGGGGGGGHGAEGVVVDKPADRVCWCKIQG